MDGLMNITSSLSINQLEQAFLMPQNQLISLKIKIKWLLSLFTLSMSYTIHLMVASNNLDLTVKTLLSSS